MHTHLLWLTGVSGSGKTTIGRLLAEKTGLPFFDGDDFHPEENIRKMSAGQALNDDDRAGWLQALHAKALEQSQQKGAIFACSALKVQYRTLLSLNLESNTHFVLLEGTFEQISQRLAARKGHYMPPSLLQSQFDILEKSDNALVVNIHQEPETIAHQIINALMKKEFGLIGLGVMGKSLSRNLASKGFQMALFNRHVAGKEEHIARDFIAAFPDELAQAQGFDQLPAFVQALSSPRKIMLMVNAGAPTDAIIAELIPLLEPGDVLIDGGNTHYKDTQRRMDQLAKLDIHLIGSGVSGGEEGALKGPSIMPGGEQEAYQLVQPYLEKIAARDKNNGSCCTWIGKGGAGHFVKMVHNGIEYAEMQLLAETYFLLRRTLGLNPDAIADALEQWAHTSTNSYLLEITVQILRKKENGTWLLDQILDAASNKGTGGWATAAAAELGIPATMISEALFARYLSAFVEERQKASEELPLPTHTRMHALTPDDISHAYQLARIVNHHQGIHLISAASETYQWNLNLPELARIWTNGCIIRSALMEQLTGILAQTNRILVHPEMANFATQHRNALNQTVQAALQSGIAIPCYSAAINFLHGYAETDSPMNLIQAQRDFFGAHTYQRKDDPKGKARHTEW